MVDHQGSDGSPEATAAVPAALAVVLIGAVSPREAVEQMTRLGSVVVFLEHDHDPGLGEFTRVGVVTVVATLLGATVSLWAVLSVFGG